MYQSFKDHLQTGSQRPGVCDDKIRHNILKEDGFENADPEISRVFPSYPELSREGQKKSTRTFAF